MNGQLNSNIYNASNNEADIEELQKQIDSLNTSVGSISEKIDETTEALNEYKAENKKQISTAAIISTDASVDNLSSNTIDGTTLCITGTSNQKDINATDICATGDVHANRIYGSLIGGAINGVCVSATNGKISNCLTAGTLNACNVHSAGNLTGDALTTNSICNNGDATITGCLKAKGIQLTNGTDLRGNGVDVCSVWARNVLCVLGHASIDCDLKVKGNITGTICGNVDSNKAIITNGTIDNLTVNNTLTVANGITLPNTLGDTTLTSVTTDKLVVNGDTELNGAVKAGSITIGDGSITAGEVCIGAKGVVIDKDKNAAFADISSSNLTAENVNINTKINASCVESNDVVSKNTFAKNLYPENITIDKNVGDLHYSRQLDTDAVGGVLVDCKTVTPVEGATGVITKYKDTEANTINANSVEYVNEKNGIKVVSCSTADKTSNAITLDTGINAYSIKADETGFGIYAGDEKAFGIGVDGKTNLCICKCTGADTLVGNIVKLDESGNLYTGRADGLSDGVIVDGVCSNTLKNTAINIDSNISREAVGYNCYYNCYTRSLGSTQNKIYDYCRDSSASCNECSYDITATTDKVTATFCNCCNMTGGTTISKETYELHPRMVCHNIAVDSKTDNLLICHSPQSATLLGRYSHINDAYSWETEICDSNICITNPSRTTTGEPEIIFKVEDGKIYTKCGEFTSGGGSGGFFEDATFSNDCVCAERTITSDKGPVYTWTDCLCNYIYNDNISWCITTKKAATNCIFGSYFDKDGFHKINCYCTPNESYECICSNDITTSVTKCCNGGYNCYKASTNDITCCKCQFFSNYKCCYYYHCQTCNNICSVQSTDVSCTLGNNITCCIVQNCCYNYNTQECISSYIYTAYDTSRNRTCACSQECCCSPTYNCSIIYAYNPQCIYKCDEGVEVNVGFYCYSINSDVRKLCNCGKVTAYWEDYEGMDEDNISYCSTCNYDTFLNVYHDCFCFNASNNDVSCTLMLQFCNNQVNRCYKLPNITFTEASKITTNPITALPLTNTLVPLAGTVNGNGFAFFCKGSDGIKFYDSAFAAVDAGTATNVTYLVTTGV